MSFKAGFAKKEINVFFPGLGMMGYGQLHNIVQEQATPLYARASAFQDQEKNCFIHVIVELCFATIAVKEEATKRLQIKFPELHLSLANVMIASQHTHSAPGGYTHYPFYNITIPGFRTDLFNHIAEGIVEAVTEAVQNLEPVQINLGSYDIPEDQNVAFNRSMSAYFRNPEARKFSPRENFLAVNRRMQGLNIDDLNGQRKAHMNWFGVHTTSISSHNTRIHHDNKGVAAAVYEKNNSSFAVFAQAAAGDVSPNYIWDKKLKRMRGTTVDQYENAALNGEIQASSAEKIKTEVMVQGQISFSHSYFDMSLKAAHAAHGLGFFRGTLEGPGVSSAAVPVLKAISKAVKHYRLLTDPEAHADFYKQHEPKNILFDHRNGNFFGLPLSVWKVMTKVFPPPLNLFSENLKNGSLQTLPWVPEILPFQIVHLGNVTLIAVPGEITTVAAERLKTALQSQYKDQHLIINSYANAYMGYITTPEEYDEQGYEGGHCVYGRNTLPAMIEYYKMLPEKNGSQECFKFPPEQLAKRSYLQK
jgi:neutral ceramidase